MNNLYREIIKDDDYLIILYGDDTGYFEDKNMPSIHSNLKFNSDISFEQSKAIECGDPTHNLVGFDIHSLPEGVLNLLEKRGVYLH